MKILIDGYNLIHTIPAIAEELDRDLESSRNSLIRLLHSYRSSKNDIYPITVVFDGQKEHLDRRNTPPRGINITYSRGETADELIVNMEKNEYKGYGKFWWNVYDSAYKRLPICLYVLC